MLYLITCHGRIMPRLAELLFISISVLCFQIFIQCKLLILLPKYNRSNLSDYYRIFGKILLANILAFLY